MPPKPRQVKMENKSALAAMQRLESRSDEELLAETRFRAAAQAILGARAAERMDAKRSREHFRAAIAAARPQERPVDPGRVEDVDATRAVRLDDLAAVGRGDLTQRGEQRPRVAADPARVRRGT